ncbi:MAG: hypothetical protein LBF42_00395, partial [Puniceicoccales bacterium]|nr:hypothetical protein [Puniceicoccales bacterium]
MGNVQRNLNQKISSYPSACTADGWSIKSPVVPDRSVENTSKTGDASMSNRPSTARQNETYVRDLKKPMRQHRKNGNCMWYAINEACGGNGNRVLKLKQGSDINALNLKRLIYEKLFVKLEAKCQNLKPVNFDQEIAVINSIIVDGFSGSMANGKSYDLNEARFDLGNESSESIPDYFEENGIKDVSDITYDQLKTIMAKLSKASAKARNNMAFFKYLADCPKDGHPFA